MKPFSTQPVIILARPQRGLFQGCVYQRDAYTGWRPCRQIAELEAATEADALAAAQAWVARRGLLVVRVGPPLPVVAGSTD